MGRYRDAVAQVDSAVQLDPLSFLAGVQRELVLYTAGRYREVIAQVRRNSEIDPQGFYFDAYDGPAYRELGVADSSLAAFSARKAVGDWQPLGGLAVLYARQGRTKEAADIARALEHGIGATTTRRSTSPSRGQPSATPTGVHVAREGL